MLLTDGNPNTSSDLSAYETAILTVANTEMINLDTKLTLATEEISEDVLDVLLDHTRSTWPLTDLRRKKDVSDVVVTSQMKRWHALYTLSIIYRDAFNNQLNDRYQAKWSEYQKLAREARSKALGFGIGIVGNPIPAASLPVLSSVAGTLPQNTYFVETTWVSAQGQEGAPSAATNFDTPAGSFLIVQNGPNAPAEVSGYNVYLGLSVNSIALQNATPVPIGQVFTMPALGLMQGKAPSAGQQADYYVTGGPTLRRG